MSTPCQHDNSLAATWQTWAEVPAFLLVHGDVERVKGFIALTLLFTAADLQRLGVPLTRVMQR